jgi:hypothetical protein
LDKVSTHDAEVVSMHHSNLLNIAVPLVGKFLLNLKVKFGRVRLAVYQLDERRKDIEWITHATDNLVARESSVGG